MQPGLAGARGVGRVGRVLEGTSPEVESLDVLDWVGLSVARGCTATVTGTGLSAAWVTDDLGFVFVFFLVSAFVPHLAMLLSGHHLVLWLLGSHLHRTYLLDGLILTSYFSGLVV